MFVEFLMGLSHSCPDLLLQDGGETHLAAQVNVFRDQGNLIRMVFSQARDETISERTEKTSLPLASPGRVESQA